MAKQSGILSEYWWCRAHPIKEHIPNNPDKLRQRQKPSFDAIGCKMKMKVVKADGFVEITRHGDAFNHCHDLDYSDRRKRPSFIRRLAAEQVASATKVSAVSHTLRAMDRPTDRQRLRDAGAQHTTLKDIHNAGAEWKRVNGDQRRRGAPENWTLQQLDALEWLQQQGGEEGEWEAQNICVERDCDGEVSKLTLAYEHLLILQKRLLQGLFSLIGGILRFSAAAGG